MDAPILNCNVEEPGGEKLYDGCGISKLESAVAILTVFIKHNLSKACLNDILSLIALHIPPATDFFSSKYRFFKFLQTVPAPIERHLFCS